MDRMKREMIELDNNDFYHTFTDALPMTCEIPHYIKRAVYLRKGNTRMPVDIIQKTCLNC